MPAIIYLGTMLEFKSKCKACNTKPKNVCMRCSRPICENHAYKKTYGHGKHAAIRYYCFECFKHHKIARKKRIAIFAFMVIIFISITALFLNYGT